MTTGQTPQAASPSFTVSGNAARRIKEIMIAETPTMPYFRVAVSGGGCSGFQYHFALDNTRNGDDLAVVQDGVTVVIDETSLDLLRGAELDYAEELIGASFRMRNPNAASSCGCGNSFAV